MRRYAPSLADLYIAAVHLVYDSPVPGRVILASHAVREICNRLPGRVSGVEGDGYLNYRSRLDEIAAGWKRAGRRVEAAVPLEPGAGPQDTSTQASLDVSLPPDAYALVAELVRDHLRARTRPEEAARRFFAAATAEDGPLSPPVIRQWLETRDWFMAHAHDSGRVDTDFSEDELRSAFELFEQSLFAVARGFYNIMDELDAILADTNA